MEEILFDIFRQRAEAFFPNRLPEDSRLTETACAFEETLAEYLAHVRHTRVLLETFRQASAVGREIITRERASAILRMAERVLRAMAQAQEPFNRGVSVLRQAGLDVGGAEELAQVPALVREMEAELRQEWATWRAEVPATVLPTAFHIPPLAYLRSCWATLWGALRHPFSYTLVDLSTGASVHLSPPKYRAWLRGEL